MPRPATSSQHAPLAVAGQPLLRGWPLWRRWTSATAWGELAGFAVPAFAGAATAAAGFPAAPQAAVMVVAGAGEGAVLGWAQSRPLRRALPSLDRRRWIAATSSAAGVAWAIGMVPATLGETLGTLPFAVLLAGGTLLAAALLASIGTAQWLVLRRHVAGARLWVPANVLAWTAGLTACFSVMSFTAEGNPVAVNAAVGILSGLAMGIGVAAVTGLALVQLLDRRRPAAGPRR